MSTRYFDVFLSGSPENAEYFSMLEIEDADKKIAQEYLKRFFNAIQNPEGYHSYDFVTDVIVKQKFAYYTLVFVKNTTGSRSTGHLALTIRTNGWYHSNIHLMQNLLYLIYLNYIKDIFLKTIENGDTVSHIIVHKTLSGFFNKDTVDSITNLLNSVFAHSYESQGVNDFSQFSNSGKNEICSASTDNATLIKILKETTTLRTYPDKDEVRKVESEATKKIDELTNTIKKLKDDNNKLKSNATNYQTQSPSGNSKKEKESTNKIIKEKDRQIAELEQYKKIYKPLNELLNILRGMNLEGISNNESSSNENTITGSNEESEENSSKSGSVKFSHEIRKYISWSITLVSLIVVLIMGLSSGDTEDVEKLQNDLAQAKQTISDRDNDIQNYKSENKKLTDSLGDYRKKIADIGGVLKVENKSSQAKSLDPNYKPSIGSKSDKKFKVGTSYPVSFANGAEYEWSVKGEGAEKEGDKVKIISKKPFTIVVKDDDGKEVYRREVSINKIVE